jgi:hypothetical protein
MTRRVSTGALALVLAFVLPLGSAAGTVQKPAAQKPAPQAQPPAQAQKPAEAAPKPASQPAAGQAPAAPAAKPAAPLPAPAADTYSYRAEGRRDPFVSLLNRGSDPRAQRKAEGLAGLLAGDAVLKGILQSKGTYLAIVQGPNEKRQLIVRPNDRFADGVVKAITADSMLILQEVNDPLSLTKQREIRKTLRAVEEVK